MTEIDCGGIAIITFTDGRIAEIAINPAAKPVSADMLARVMLTSRISAAKIVRIQTAKEIPPPRFDQEGGGQSKP